MSLIFRLQESVAAGDQAFCDCRAQSGSSVDQHQLAIGNRKITCVQAMESQQLGPQLPRGGGEVRKISPNGVKDDFRKQLAALLKFHDVGVKGLATESDQSTFVEHSLLAAAVIWEGFVSDMFIAYINGDAARFKQHLQASFEEHMKAGATPKRVFDTFGKLELPGHLTKAQVQSLADGVGNNITFPNFGELEDRAGTWLSAAHASKFTALTAQQKATVNAVIALRNHIAHRSKRSLDAMNDALAKGALHPTGLKRLDNRFHNVGAWLKAKPVGLQTTRFSLIMTALDGIGATF